MPLIEAVGIKKSFAGVRALRGASLAVEEGTVHGLVGHNGAGKSTLIRVLAGLIKADEGSVAVDGEPLHQGHRRDSIAKGILSVPQELTVLPGLGVTENICVGNESRRGPLLSRRRMRARAAEALELLGIEGLSKVPVEDLTAAQQRIVMIAMALSRPCRLLILDEPTASLGPENADSLMEILEALPGRGVSVLYISHRLDEVVRICDRVSVMREGVVTETLERSANSVDALVSRMVDEVAEATAPRPKTATARDPATAAVTLRRVVTPALNGVDFEIPRGEITGFTGLVGSGVEDVLAVIAGVRSPEAGELEIDGVPVRLRTPADALGVGVGYIAGSRASAGLRDLSVRENVVVSSLDRAARLGLTNRVAQRRRAHGFVDNLGLGDRLEDPLANLSGGNQQKAIVARLLAAEVQIMVLDDPTAGVDVRARADLHGLLRQLADQGRTVIVRSSEPEEFIAFADRVHVLAGGRLVETFAGDGLDPTELLRAFASSGREARTVD
jgi:ribose transport system ATP-binding protein